MRKYLCLILFFWCGAANAGLLNSNVVVTSRYFGPVSATTVVTQDVEWLFPTPFLIYDLIDLGDDYIYFDYPTGACCMWSLRPEFDFLGFELAFDSGVLSDLLDVSFAPNTDGYVDSMLSYENDTLFVNWRGGLISGVEGVRINLTFDSVSVPVALPSTLMLLGLVVTGLWFSRKRDMGTWRLTPGLRVQCL